MTVRVVNDREGSILKAIRDLTSKEVLVGIPGETTERKTEDGEAGPTNAMIGYVMEFGDPDQNIPARPFLVPGVTAAMPRVIPQLKAAGQAAIAGKATGVDVALNAAGIAASDAVRDQIDKGPFVPLSPRTLAARAARGRTGTKPLIDTAQLMRSITYAVRPRGKG